MVSSVAYDRTLVNFSTLIPYIGFIANVIPLKVSTDMDSGLPRVTQTDVFVENGPLELSTWLKFMSHDWLLLDHSVCPVIDHEFRHNIVKVAVDPQGSGRLIHRLFIVNDRTDALKTDINLFFYNNNFLPIRRPFWILLFQISIMGCSGGKYVLICSLSMP